MAVYILVCTYYVGTYYISMEGSRMKGTLDFDCSKSRETFNLNNVTQNHSI